VTAELAAELQAALALHDVTDGGGMSASVTTADGAWSGQPDERPTGRMATPSGGSAAILCPVT
jgi:hypothetical protein